MIVNSNGDDEWRNPDDQSLKTPGFQTILDAKAAVDGVPRCRYKVSCADILALAAREAVSQVLSAKQLEIEFPMHEMD
jgi:peroxidase